MQVVYLNSNVLLTIEYDSKISKGLHLEVPQYISIPWSIKYCMALTISEKKVQFDELNFSPNSKRKNVITLSFIKSIVGKYPFWMP